MLYFESERQYTFEDTEVEGIIDILRGLRLPREEITKVRNFLDAVDSQDESACYNRIVKDDGTTELVKQ